MSVGTLVEAVMGRRQKKEQKSLETWNEAVAAGANGEDVDVARLDAILLDNARTPQQYAAAVEEYKQRRADAALAATLPALEKERDEAGSNLGTRRDAVANATREYQAAQQVYLARNGQLSAEIDAARAARNRLRAGRPDDREAELRKAKGHWEQRRGELTNELGNDAAGLKGRLKNLRLALKHGPQPNDSLTGPLPPSIVPGLPYEENRLRDNIALTEGNIRGIDTELTELDARLAEVNATLAKIEQRQLSAE